MPSPPRRSTRGAAPAAPPSTTSSSLSSARQDRSVRGGHSQKSATPRSQSSEDTSEPPRRSQRAQASTKDDHDPKQTEAIEDGDEEAVDEEDITRCVCGNQEYPGPPQSEAFPNFHDAQAEDAGGWFISCDGCSVWQHGGCVGIVEESSSPEKYYCEQCRPKMHTISQDSRGQKYSLYLPLHPKANRKASTSKSEKDAKKERAAARDARESVDPSTGKRRTTMRSREHDDEDEQLRKAIEESQRETGVDSTTTGRRNGKRGRDDSSEDSKQESKRQRRASETVPSIEAAASIEDDSDEGANTAAGRAKKAKADAALLAREAERKEKDKEREKQKAEAAGRRQERARSRRNDDAEAAEDTSPKPTPSAKTSPPPPSSQPPSPPPADKAPPKKGPGKKPVKKLGNNQYTKAKYEQAASSPHGRKRQTLASGSGDEASETLANGETNGNTSGGGGGGKTSPAAENGTVVGTGKSKFGRGKKNAVNGNGVKQTDGDPVVRTYTNMNSLLAGMIAATAKEGTQHLSEMQVIPEIGLRILGGPVQADWASSLPPDDKPDEELTSLEMGARVQRNMLKWQATYGHLQREATQVESSSGT